MNGIFLGDASRQRVLSPSPTSPPMSPAPNPLGRFVPPPIDPQSSLELRIRWLEVLLLGIKQDASPKSQKERLKTKEEGKQGEKETLVFQDEQTQKRFDGVVESNDGLRKFMDRYDQHTQILTSVFALPGASAQRSYLSMSAGEPGTIIAEMEPGICGN